ncbi:GNAT family N-acetyltransferase [Parendozoicomonas haliclonae]|uniref:Putative N-acetyltransferase YvbK n=2 Tax=Parendozoicomonas haliclonae TaxID=1960125 RepID=A0A1X7AJU9_9GAMM|nr:putative N-acetyltransferase YvbK [Parendozoicomonas haliclonae]
MPLLLEADPSEDVVNGYLADSWCFVAKEGADVVAACVVQPLATSHAELMNIAVWPDRQQEGIGSRLLRTVLEVVKAKGIQKLELGTGTFGHQLTFYQRLGFRVDAVIKDHFLDHYLEPIFESGIQHKDMLRLSIVL